ncbi:putative endoplasmic reticulum metallopeptidase 1-A [Melitaea cinxia]|uniref:putative endoplasmic reticulum metallopeptidase 1-A n=1 Tax=Melitaea cinxia TaxID=113334 RepID=UPI001E2725CE|nr:putative endoplasmic reticulum metallopeptidase 1-A [Melitaea cinxia]
MPSHHTVPSPYIILLFVFYLLLLFLTKAIEDDLPSVVQEKDISKDDSNTFSEATARKYLHRILGDKPRVAGTEYHLEKTKDIKDMVDEIASKANLPVRTDWQFASGDYWLAFNSPHVNIYHNISNIIAVLEGDSGFPNGTIGTSLLVNCHYDSVPFAMGASDNGVFCSAMAEILSKLSRRKEKLKHNVVFLFNGAEESPLMASHGFLQHPWSKGVMNVINLDSAGMNGKPSLFQVTDPRVLEMYKKSARRPNAQGVGEVLFASGIIPSDTDFRIFRDFGAINGVDIAFIKGGNVYHTRNDKADFIQEGVIQNAGDMLLGLIRELADSDILETKEPQSTFVYYDYIGLFLVTYSRNTALIVDVLVGILGVSSVLYFLWMFGLRRSSVMGLLWSTMGRLFTVTAGLLVVLFLTSIMILTTTQMRYLSAQWMVLPLYVLPHLVTAVYAVKNYVTTCSQANLSRSIRTSQAMSATRLLLSVSLLALCCVPALANIRYIITVPLLSMSVTSFISVTLVRYGNMKAWQHLLLEVVLATPAAMFGLSLSLRLIPFLIPIMGRSAADNPDYVIAIVTTGLTIVTFCVVSGIELLFSRRRLRAVLGGVFVSSAVFMAIPLNPYSGLTTQRHYWFHTQVTTYNANQTPTESVSGVLITRPDLYSVPHALKAIKDSPYYEKDGRLNNESLIIKDSDLTVITLEKCATRLYCDMPLYRTRFEKYNINSLFVRMSPPEQFEHSLKLVNKTCTDDTCVLNFVTKSPGYESLAVSPRPAVGLANWSLSAPLQETAWLDGRPVFVFVRAVGSYSERVDPLEFSLTFSKARAHSAALADVTHHAHRVHHPPHFTDHYKALLAAMPEYFNVATFLSFRDNYVF